MEDSLWPVVKGSIVAARVKVLILVWMEDSLWHDDSLTMNVAR